MPPVDILAGFEERFPRLPSFGRTGAALGLRASSGRMRGDLAEALAGRRAEGALAIATSPREAPSEEGRPAAGARGWKAALPKARKAAGRGLRAILSFVLYAHLAFILSTSLLIIIYARVDPPVTVLMAYRKFSSGFSVRRPIPVKLKQIGRRRRDILIRVEDWTFYSHYGIEPAAIKNAARINKQIGRPMYGGSTLSMQTARTLFLVPFKSYFRKYLEAIVTLELELFLTKDRILELYYSCAEWGRGIFGIQAASYAYYGAPVWNLSDEQYIRLVSLLSSPVRYTPATLFKNSLLAWRYNFLMGRFTADPAPAQGAADGADGSEQGGNGAQASANASVQDGPSAAIAPPAQSPAPPAQSPAPPAQSPAPAASFTPAPNG